MYSNYRDVKRVAEPPKSDITKPQVFGPGLWWGFHTDSFAVTTFSEKQDFVNRFIFKLQRLPCKVCSGHAVEYLQNNDITKYYDDPPINELRAFPTAKGKGLAFYIWKFHNTVNLRLNKPQINWSDCIIIYTTDVACDTECDVDEKKVQQTTTTSKQIKWPNQRSLLPL